MFLIYTFLYCLALLIVFPFELRKRPEPERPGWVREKLGFLPAAGEGAAWVHGAIWVHAVSVGEVAAAVPFIEALREKGADVVVSTITGTGRKMAREKLPWAPVFHMPFDIPFCLKRAIRRARPAAFIMIETELWPNAVNQMHKAGIPVFIVNGRLSEKSFQNYRKAKFFIGPVLRKIDILFMQDAVYAERALELGAKRDSVRVSGNFKFEVKPKGGPPFWLQKLSRPVIVAGSTHLGEEETIAQTVKRLKAGFPSLFLVLAPRHPERKQEAAEALRIEGLQCVFSSEIKNSSLLPGCVVVDTVGQLFQIYSAADIVVIGGSFIPHGGQNPLEALYWGKSVVTGPHMENFPFMKDLLERQAAVSVDKHGLYGLLDTLLKDDNKRAGMGAKGRRYYEEHSGAVEKTLREIEAAYPSLFRKEAS